MDISTLTADKQVKLQYWLDVIRQCRASGLTNQAWCEQHDVSLKSYYYWIAKIRKLALEELPRKNHGYRPAMDQTALVPDTTPGFTELSLRGRRDSGTAPAAVLHTSNRIIICVSGFVIYHKIMYLKSILTEKCKSCLPAASQSLCIYALCFILCTSNP